MNKRSHSKILELIDSISAYTCGTSMSQDEYNEIMEMWNDTHKDLSTRIVSNEKNDKSDDLAASILERIRQPKESLSDDWEVIKLPLLAVEEPIDAGMFYCPYVPMSMISLVRTLNPKKIEDENNYDNAMMVVD